MVNNIVLGGIGFARPDMTAPELAEELGIDAQIGDLIIVAKHTTDSGKAIELHAYEILGYTGKIQLRIHDDMHWVPILDLPAHPQLPADLIVSKTLAQNLD